MLETAQLWERPESGVYIPWASHSTMPRFSFMNPQRGQERKKERFLPCAKVWLPVHSQKQAEKSWPPGEVTM